MRSLPSVGPGMPRSLPQGGTVGTGSGSAGFVVKSHGEVSLSLRRSNGGGKLVYRIGPSGKRGLGLSAVHTGMAMSAHLHARVCRSCAHSTHFCAAWWGILQSLWGRVPGFRQPITAGAELHSAGPLCLFSDKLGGTRVFRLGPVLRLPSAALRFRASAPPQDEEVTLGRRLSASFLPLLRSYLRSQGLA